jgi:hypothetical protein
MYIIAPRLYNLVDIMQLNVFCVRKINKMKGIKWKAKNYHTVGTISKSYEIRRIPNTQWTNTHTMTSTSMTYMYINRQVKWSNQILHPRFTVILSVCYIRQITQTKTNNLPPSIVHCVGSFVITFSLAKKRKYQTWFCIRYTCCIHKR